MRERTAPGGAITDNAWTERRDTPHRPGSTPPANKAQLCLFNRLTSFPACATIHLFATQPIHCTIHCQCEGHLGTSLHLRTSAHRRVGGARTERTAS